MIYRAEVDADAADVVELTMVAAAAAATPVVVAVPLVGMYDAEVYTGNAPERVWDKQKVK